MKIIVALLAILLGSHAAADAYGKEQAAPLRIALLPFTNTMAVMQLYQPLRLSLERQLGRPVALFTAPNFVQHFQDIRSGDFDIAVTGPHFGAWAIRNGHLAVLRYRPILRPVMVVQKQSSIQGPEQLRHRIVALSNRLSVSSITGEGWIASHGMEAGRDYEVRDMPTHTTAIMAVAMGEADAAITTETPVRQAPSDVRDKIRVIESPVGVPHLFTIANQRLGQAEAARLRAALLAFASSPDGVAFLGESGYQGYTDISDSDLASMTPVLDILHRLAPDPGQSP